MTTYNWNGGCELDQLAGTLPQQMVNEPRWVLWRIVDRIGNPTKLPKRLDGYSNAKSNDPSTWGTFEEAVDALKRINDPALGIGFMLGDGYAGVDFDLAIVDDQVTGWARDIYRSIKHFSYVEFSPSGKGFKATFLGEMLAGSDNKKSFGEGKTGIEVYDGGRFWTITGEKVDEDNFGQADEAFDELCRVHLGGGVVPQQPENIQISVASMFPSDSWDRAVAYIEECDCVSDGGRDNKLFSVCGNLWAFPGITEDQVLRLAMAYNATKVSPPLDEFTVKQKVRSSQKNGTARPIKEEQEVTFTNVTMPLDPNLLSSDSEYDCEDFATEVKEEIGEFPIEAAKDGGMIETLMKEFNRCSKRTSPELNFCVALNTLSAVTSRIVRDDSYYRTTTRLFCAVTAPSGGGKNAPLKFVNDVIRKCRPEIEAPNDLTSVAGLLERLHEHPTRVSVIDELADTIADVSQAKRGGSMANSKLHSVLKEIATSTWNTNFNPRMVLSNVRNGRDGNDLTSNCPHFSIFGVTATDSFYEAFEESSQTDGFLGRWMVFNVDRTAKRRRIDREAHISEVVIEHLGRWANYNVLKNAVIDPDSEDETLLPDDLFGEPTMKVVRRSKDACDRLEEHFVQCEDRADEEEESGDKLRAAIWRRAGEKTALLALIFAISRHKAEPTEDMTLELEDANRAIEISNFLTRRMVIEFESREMKTEWQKIWMPIIQKIKIGETISKRALHQRASGRVKARDLKSVVETAHEAGYVSLSQGERKGTFNITRIK